MKRLTLVSVVLFFLAGCHSNENSSSIDATINTSDRYVYFLREFCSKENVKIKISQTAKEGEDILEFHGGGMTFTPCPDKKIRKAYSNLTPEDVEEFRERYRSRNAKQPLK